MIADEEAARAWLRSRDWCDAAAFDRLEMFAAMLAEENARQNLVAQASLDAVWLRHIVDSAQLLQHVPRETLQGAVRQTVWLDLGTGAGMPGLVIAAICPAMRVVMVESRRKRIEWLESAIARLGLGEAKVIGTRLEAVASIEARIISARAFAPLEKLLSLSARFSTPETLWLLPKGRSAAQELGQLRGWRHAFHVEQSLTDPDSGIIVGSLAGRKGSKP